MRQFWAEQPATWLLVLLLSTDLLFMVLHGVHTSTQFLDNPNLSITEDRGFAAGFQYVKEYWIIVLLLWLFLRHWEPPYALWACLFSYVLMIDGFKPHRTEDLSTLIALTLLGAFLLGMIAIAYRYSTAELKHVCRQLARLLAAFLCFAVLVDGIPWWDGILELVERAGELTMISLVCWYLVTQLAQPQAVDELCKHT